MSTMSDRQKSCEERIEGELSSRLSDIADLFRREEGADEEDRMAALEELDEYPLSIGSKRVYTILISTGGPADWFEATVDDGEIERIEYVYQDWFDGARRTLDLSSEEGKTAERFCDYFIQALAE